MIGSHLGRFDSPEPSADLSAPLQALWWIRKGEFKVGDEWRKAHEICQSAEGNKDHDWIHALVHLIEGDHANADYWYRHAGEAQKSADPQTEWAHIVEQLGGN